MIDGESSFPGCRKCLNSIGHARDRAALVTPCLSHLPFHPSCFLGYGAALLAGRYDLEVMDLNAELHFKHREKLKPILDIMDKAQFVSDALFLYPFYQAVETHIDGYYAEIPWKKYPLVYVTPPSWFPTVPTEAVLRLSRAIKRVSSETRIFFFGNSLGSWTNEWELEKNGVQTVHLNGLCELDPTAKPVRYDLLPTPIYENRNKYLFDLLPFMLKHGCSWGRCRFCSLSKGWNSGYLERSPKAAIMELEALIDQYAPAALVCRDNSLNGHNLVEFCGYLERFNKPWYGMSRADLSGKKIQALWKAGCKGIFFGLESGSDRTLSAMNKGITSKQLSNFIKRLHSNGILPAPSIIIGAPGEGRVNFEKTIQFLMDHRRYFEIVNVYPFRATPASEFASQKKQPAPNTLMRLFQFIQTCENLGLQVCVGEQCAEYVLFKRFYNGHLAVS
ncbi:MAG: B12-binding domain-containing radical SAM protein [Desulfomonilaceae bacterium]